MNRSLRMFMLVALFVMLTFSLGVTLAQTAEANPPASPDITAPILVEASRSLNLPYALLVICIAALVVATLGVTYLAYQANKSAASNVPLQDAVTVLDKGIELAARLLAPSIYRSPYSWDDDLFETTLSLRGYTVSKRDDGVIELHRKQDGSIVPPAEAR